MPKITRKYPVGTEVIYDGLLAKVIDIDFLEPSSLALEFPNGTQIQAPSTQVTMRHRDDLIPLRGLAAFDVGVSPIEMTDRHKVLFAAIVGSRAYGLASEKSDTDVRGIWQADHSLLFGLGSFGATVSYEDHDESYWEIRHAFRLLLSGNPTALEAIYSPLPLLVDGSFNPVLENRDRFLSRKVYETYVGYVKTQLRRMDSKSGNTKHFMHLIRLLISGTCLLEEGTLAVDMTEHRAFLLSLRDDPPDDAERAETYNYWLRRIEEAYQKTSLPASPDYLWAESYLQMLRFKSVGEQW